MVDVTLLELDLEGAEFNAPFSGKEGKLPSGGKLSRKLKRSSKSSSSSSSLLSGDDGDASSGLDVAVTKGEKSPSAAIPILFLGALVVMFAVLRKLRSRSSRDQQHELVEYEA